MLLLRSRCTRSTAARRALRPVFGAALSLLSIIGTGCSVPRRGATAADIAQAQTATPDGSLVFESYCAECHGPRGAGTGDYPALVGENALANHANALELHAYVEAHMPKIGKAELAAPDYWTVVTFVAVANRAQVPDDGMDATNAAQVMLHPE